MTAERIVIVIETCAILFLFLYGWFMLKASYAVYLEEFEKRRLVTNELNECKAKLEELSKVKKQHFS